jgi:sporulation protein YlmC with PRC-barrel domain
MELRMSTASGHTQAIPASRVTGTAVYNTTGERIGHVEDVMLDKLSDNIMFAVVGFGGFLGMGEKYHPVPWSLLDYDKAKGGYVVSLSKDVLKAAPAFSVEELTKDDGNIRESTYRYYKVNPYWN